MRSYKFDGVEIETEMNPEKTQPVSQSCLTQPPGTPLSRPRHPATHFRRVNISLIHSNFNQHKLRNTRQTLRPLCRIRCGI